MSRAQCNYRIGDKELLAIVACVEKWHMYFHGIEFTIFTDDHNLQNFATKALLHRRQARWAGLLAQYQFYIQFRPGKTNGKADALTRRSGDLPCERDGRGRPVQNLLPPDKFLGFPEPEPVPTPPIPRAIFINSAVLCNSAITHNPDIREALIRDELANAIMNALQDGSKQLSGKYSRSVSLGECVIDSSGLLVVYGLLYVPNDQNLYREVIFAHQDHPAAGHPGRATTYELVSRNYWWPGMRKTIARYLAN